MQYVSVLAASRECGLAELLDVLWSSEHFISEARQAGDVRFQQLRALQGNMARLEEWFDGSGLGGLDAVFSQFECVLASGWFEFGVGDAAGFRLVFDEYGTEKQLQSEDLVVSQPPRFEVIHVCHAHHAWHSPARFPLASSELCALPRPCHLNSILTSPLGAGL